ncbi:hypothetical protein [Cohnella abietis]|uniref:Helix-turn-helix type 11 domain-containing protein n=1 Tax=Cohnella abietis TaxID=2507935 RepID=A0A3T1D2P4_9BACL|nr:hypothetical protein [Cohnella abietis]BBI32354.1 hypothetical protein KCTCHS21_17530 [Cohnella abietis]
MDNTALVEQITKTAVQAALEYMENEKHRKQKANRDQRLRNTKLLLKNYRSFIAHCDELQEKLSAIQEAETLNELHTEDYAVESIKRSKKRTMVMTRFIQQMVGVYRSMCESSGTPEDSRRYKIIDALYISDEKMTAEQLAECHKIDLRTVYKDINNAAKALSVLVFGVDGIQFD